MLDLKIIQNDLSIPCRFLTIGFYTINTGYEDEVKNLIKSIKLINIPYEIWGIKSLGSWQKNTQVKADVIKSLLLKYKKPVSYIDADAIYHQYPVLYDIINTDFAVHYLRDKELLSGTLFFNYTPGALWLINKWINKNKIQTETFDQQTLQDVYERNKDKISRYNLPPSYAKIFDVDYKRLNIDVSDTVIEGYQASRRLKKEVNNENCNICR